MFDNKKVISYIDTQFLKVFDKLQELSLKIEENDKQISLLTNMVSIRNTVTDNSSNNYTVSDDLYKNIDTSITCIYNILTEVKHNIDGYVQDISTGINNKLSIISENIDRKFNDISVKSNRDVSKLISSINTGADNTSLLLTSIQSNIDRLQSDIDGYVRDISTGINSKIDTVSETLDSLNNRKNDFDILDNKLTSVVNYIDYASSEIKEYKLEIANLKIDNHGNKLDITKLKSLSYMIYKNTEDIKVLYSILNMKDMDISIYDDIISPISKPAEIDVNSLTTSQKEQENENKMDEMITDLSKRQVKNSGLTLPLNEQLKVNFTNKNKERLGK